MQAKSLNEKRVAALRAAMLMQQARRLLHRQAFGAGEVLRQRAIAILLQACCITHFAASMFLHTHSIHEVQNGLLP